MRKFDVTHEHNYDRIEGQIYVVGLGISNTPPQSNYSSKAKFIRHM